MPESREVVISVEPDDMGVEVDELDREEERAEREAEDSLDGADDLEDDNLEEEDDKASAIDSPLVDQNPEGEEDSRKKWVAGGVICLVLVALLVAMGLAFSQDDATIAGLQQATDAPVVAPTGAPTSVVATDAPVPPPVGNPVTPPSASPTPFPTPPPVTEGGPTPEPTFDSDPGTPSELPCSLIKNHTQVTEFPGQSGSNNFRVWPLDNGNELCADTYAGYPRSGPTRNVWSAEQGRRDCYLYDYNGGIDICENVGARRCSADELGNGAAQGTGCGGDQSYLWTRTRCTTENGANGYFMINYNIKGVVEGTGEPFFRCESDLSIETVTRCCGDIYEVSQEFEDAFWAEHARP